MTTVRATVQPTTPPRVIVTVEDPITPAVELLTNGSFETPDLGGALTDFNPAPWFDYVARESPGTIRSPFVLRQGPNPNVAIAPANGARYLAAEFPGHANGRMVWMAQEVPIAAGMKVVVDAKMMASQVTGPGAGALVLQVVPTIDGDAGPTGGVATVDGPTWGAWQSLHAETTIPPGYNNVGIHAVFQGAATASPSMALIDAITATATEPVIQTVSLMRLVDGVRSPVRGAQNIAASAADMVFTDNEAPFGKQVTYVFVKRYVDGTTGETISDPVELTTALPWISHPITGVGVSATITDWSELDYAARQTIVAVAGRARPIALSDRRLAPSSEITMLTKTRSDLLALRGLLALGDVLLVRPVCDAVEGDYLAIGDVTETRVKPNGEGAGMDWRRLVTMNVQAVDIPDTGIPAIGDTLADLHAYAPTTLTALSDAFGPNATLLTIAETNLTG